MILKRPSGFQPNIEKHFRKRKETVGKGKRDVFWPVKKSSAERRQKKRRGAVLFAGGRKDNGKKGGLTNRADVKPKVGGWGREKPGGERTRSKKRKKSVGEGGEKRKAQEKAKNVGKKE